MTEKIAVTWEWWCQECPERGEGPKSDLAARKHGEATSHSTITSGRPA